MFQFTADTVVPGTQVFTSKAGFEIASAVCNTTLEPTTPKEEEQIGKQTEDVLELKRVSIFEKERMAKEFFATLKERHAKTELGSIIHDYLRSCKLVNTVSLPVYAMVLN